MYPNRGNRSEIGKAVLPALIDASAPISKARQQSRPGKPIKDKSELKFCEFCAIYVGGKGTLCGMCNSHTLPDLGQHQTKTEKHTTNVQRGIKYVDCQQCNTIHPLNASCSEKSA